MAQVCRGRCWKGELGNRRRQNEGINHQGMYRLVTNKVKKVGKEKVGMFKSPDRRGEHCH